MALEEYRRKRDFKKSPEPEGKVTPKKKSKQLFFCVQKHLASHLHYDFRLEHKGVLLSWAVPEGAVARSRDEAAGDARRRSSDRIRQFEGVIPEGYGAGIVMLWDSRHVDARGRRRRRGAEEGRPQVHARRLQAQGLLGARAHARLGRATQQATTAEAGC